MKLVISGSSGLVGSALTRLAQSAGHEVRGLSRRTRPGFTKWDPAAAAAGDAGAVEALRAAMDGTDAIVNLAGSSVDDGRLGPAHVAQVRKSRLDAAEALANAWRACEAPPPVWLQASAVGFYGDCGEDLVTTDRPVGTNLLGPVCADWEGAGLIPNGPRRCVCRIGVVLEVGGNAWEKIVKPIKFGVGGKLGSGRQWWPWITATDLARALLFLVEAQDAHGAFNLTAPEPARQIDLTRAIARRLHRPAFVPTPATAIRIALGGVADNLVLASCRARPDRLLGLGFRFDAGTVSEALDALLADSDGRVRPPG